MGNSCFFKFPMINGDGFWCSCGFNLNIYHKETIRKPFEIFGLKKNDFSTGVFLIGGGY